MTCTWQRRPRACPEVYGLFAFKGVGGVGLGRSGPECRWWRGRRARPAASKAQVRMEGCGGEWFGVPVPRLFLFVGALHPIRRQCTSSVRVHRHITCAVPPCLWRLWRLSGLRGSSVLALSSAWGTSWCLCGASCCGSSEMSHAIPRHVFQTLKSHRWNCNVLGCCTGLVWFCGPGVLRVVGCYWWCCAHWRAYWLGESQPSALWGCSSL